MSGVRWVNFSRMTWDAELAEVARRRELAGRMQQMRPETKVVYMSGYTDRVMSLDGVFDDAVAYLQKPFSADQLSTIVRRVLA